MPHAILALLQHHLPMDDMQAPASSSKFNFNIRLTIALQLLERFRLWVGKSEVLAAIPCPLFRQQKASIRLSHPHSYLLDSR
jgi:hypothetical protein